MLNSFGLNTVSGMKRLKWLCFAEIRTPLYNVLQQTINMATATPTVAFRKPVFCRFFFFLNQSFGTQKLFSAALPPGLQMKLFVTQTRSAASLVMMGNNTRAKWQTIAYGWSHRYETVSRQLFLSWKAEFHVFRVLLLCCKSFHSGAFSDKIKMPTLWHNLQEACSWKLKESLSRLPQVAKIQTLCTEGARPGIQTYLFASWPVWPLLLLLPWRGQPWRCWWAARRRGRCRSGSAGRRRRRPAGPAPGWGAGCPAGCTAGPGGTGSCVGSGASGRPRCSQAEGPVRIAITQSYTELQGHLPGATNLPGHSQMWQRGPNEGKCKPQNSQLLLINACAIYASVNVPAMAAKTGKTLWVLNCHHLKIPREKFFWKVCSLLRKHFGFKQTAWF